VDVRCFVLVKMYGNSPRELFIKSIRNRDVRINEFPLFSFHFLKMFFISWCSLFISRLIIMLFRDGINQILVGINSSPVTVLIQFSGSLFLLLDQKLRIDFLSLSIYFMDIDNFLFLDLFAWWLGEVVCYIKYQECC